MKRHTTFAMLLLLAGQVAGQGWERIYPLAPASLFDNVAKVVPTPDGGYAGIRYQAFGTPNTPFAFYRTDPDGNLTTLVSMPADSVYSQSGQQIRLLPDGNFIVCGYFSSTGTNFPKGVLYKLSAGGAVIWQQLYTNNERGTRFADILPLPDGGFVVSRNDNLTDGSRACSVAFLDSLGNLLTQMPLLTAVPSSWAGEIVRSDDGLLYVHCYSSFNGKSYLLKLNAAGEQIWIRDISDYSNYLSSGTVSALSMVGTPDSGIVFINNRYSGPDSLIVNVVKFDSGGEMSWLYNLYQHVTPDNSFVYAITARDSNVFAVMTPRYTDDSLGIRHPRLFARIDALTGAELHRSEHPLNLNTYYIQDIKPTPDGMLIAGGGVDLPADPGYYRAFLWKMDSLGNIGSNKITGKVVRDFNLDCVAGAAELRLKRFLVQAIRIGQDTLLAQTDNLGQYTFEVDTGTYRVQVLPPNVYWSPCPDSVEHTFTGLYQTQVINLPLQPEADCALPDVDVCTPFLRRCFQNTYQVRYCNFGTLPLDSATVRIVLDPYMTFVDAQPPPDSISGDTLWFHFTNTLSISECQSFYFNIELDCDSTVTGQTHCVEAHVFPDTFCLPPPGWSGASIEVTAECLGDSSVRIKAANRGTAPTTQPVDFIIVEDDVILFQGSQHLGVDQEWVQEYAAAGSYWLGEASQEPNHPLNNMPRAFVEGCNGYNSLGYPLMFSQDDSSPFIDIDCRESVASYDPNDKTGIPHGVGNAHFIGQNEDIEYTIRFQNTGTDTAFTVVLRDTLSPWLDMASLRVGAASHPFTYTLSGPRALKFTFPNIKLPPDSVNEAASQGFVHFRMKQQRDNPPGTQILNSAAIYFDFNAPVITNQTLHTVGEDFLTVSIPGKPGYPSPRALRFEPNPVQHKALLRLPPQAGQNGLFELYDSRGQLIRQTAYTGAVVEFSRKQLPDGVYFFRVSGETGWCGSGQLLAVAP